MRELRRSLAAPSPLPHCPSAVSASSDGGGSRRRGYKRKRRRRRGKVTRTRRRRRMWRMRRNTWRWWLWWWWRRLRRRWWLPQPTSCADLLSRAGTLTLATRVLALAALTLDPCRGLAELMCRIRSRHELVCYVSGQRSRAYLRATWCTISDVSQARRGTRGALR